MRLSVVIGVVAVRTEPVEGFLQAHQMNAVIGYLGILTSSSEPTIAPEAAR